MNLKKFTPIDMDQAMTVSKTVSQGLRFAISVAKFIQDGQLQIYPIVIFAMIGNLLKNF